MNNVTRIRKESENSKQFISSYLTYVSQVLASVDVDQVAEFIAELESARDDGNMVFVIGNGGSAATASHMANDLTFGAREHIDPPFRVISLTDNVAAMTAVANDTGYENMFLRQVQAYYKPGDKLIAISASGNSANIVEAAKWFKGQGGKVLSFIGFDGGNLKELSDVAVIVETPDGEYGPVEDVHMVLDHLIHEWLWSEDRKCQGGTK